ncbi:hypothetical protein [Benzoatithermus flavus]|uniref:Uncharacterized protein n=1 Tax=Benzoatithermus flavus TaxID=3108223 RepID=A0ABU8XVQ3_9PROT
MTTSGPSRAIRLFGTEEPVPETPTLRAGPLEASLDAGNLRHVKLAGREAIRAISYIVRDKNWGTYNPRISNLRIEQDADGFRVTYDAVCEDAQQSFAYSARIEADRHGNLSFTADGEARTDFLTNRTGFVVLHGVEGVSGAPVEVEHVDGTIEKSRFPELIDPMCPFKDIRALTHEVFPGARVTCRMEGDTFEMEDQRNWTDASYKTYVRPLALPWPYTIKKGDRFTQKVTLTVEGRLPAGGGAAAAGPVTVTVGTDEVATMPAVGLAVPAEHVAAALERTSLLRPAAPAFLVGAFDARQGHDAGLLRAYGELARALGAELVLEAVLPCVDAEGRPTDDLATLRRDLDHVRRAVGQSGVKLGRIAVSPACDLKCTLPGSIWPKAPAWADLIAATRAAFPDIAVGGGMFSYFTELNRKRPPVGLLDFIVHTTCPLVHAGDDLSLTEGLESLPYVFRSTQAFAGGKPYWLFPTAISMRANPYGAAPAENPDQGRVAMARVDPRERGLIGAAWYAGYLAHAARAGLAAVTLAAVTGPSGIVHTPQDHPQPWFDDHPDAVLRPSYHVLRGATVLRGGAVLGTESSAPRDVQVLAVRSRTGVTLWLANLTGAQQEVRLAGDDVAGTGTLALLDEGSFEAACRDPDALDRIARPASTEALTLPAYAVARLVLAGRAG